MHVVEQDLRFAGIAPGNGTKHGTAYWDEFVAAVRGLLAAL